MYSAKYSETTALIILIGTLTLSAVNIYGTEFGSLSLKKTVLFFAAYDDIRSSANGFNSVKPL